MKNEIQFNIINNQKQEIVSNDFLNPKNNKTHHESCVFSYQQLRNTELMNRFVNFLTKKGKKSKAESIFSKTLYIFMKKIQQERGTTLLGGDGQKKVQRSIEPSISILFHQSIENVIPFFEVKKVRVAGTTYLVPSLIQSHRQEKLAMNWIIESALSRKKKNPKLSFDNCLAVELYEAFLKQGQARNKRNELHKLAEAQRAFSHFRWW